MPKLNLVLTMIGGVAMIAATGCSGVEGKCSKAIDNATQISIQMVQAMAMLGGEKGKAKAAEAKVKIEEAVAAKKPEAVKQCVKAAKEDTKVEAAIDCVANAKDIAGLQKCEGADFLKNALKK